MQGLPGLQGPGLDLGQLGLRPGPLGPSFSGVTPSTLAEPIATIYYSCKMLQVKHCQTWQKHKSDKLARQTFQILSAHVLLRGWTRSDAVQLPGPSDAAGRCFTTSNSRLLILGSSSAFSGYNWTFMAQVGDVLNCAECQLQMPTLGSLPPGHVLSCDNSTVLASSSMHCGWAASPRERESMFMFHVPQETVCSASVLYSCFAPCPGQGMPNPGRPEMPSDSKSQKMNSGRRCGI